MNNRRTRDLQVERRAVKFQPFGREEGGLGQSLGSQEKTENGTPAGWPFPSFILCPESFAHTCFPSDLGTHTTPKAKQVPPDPSPSHGLPAPSQLVSYSQSPWQRPHSSQEMGRELGPWQGEGDLGGPTQAQG